MGLIRRSSVMRRHPGAGPSENGVQLMRRRAVVRRSSRGELAQPMSGFFYTGSAAGFFEGVAEALSFVVGFSILDERER
jgi:hypothetical protein